MLETIAFLVAIDHLIKLCVWLGLFMLALRKMAGDAWPWIGANS